MNGIEWDPKAQLSMGSRKNPLVTFITFTGTEQCSFAILEVWLQSVMKTKESWGRVSIRNFSFLSDFQSTVWTRTCSYVSLQLQTKIVMYKSRKLKCQQRQVSLLNLALIYLLLSIYSRDSGGMKCLGHSRNVYAWWIREEKAGTKYDLFTGLDV